MNPENQRARSKSDLIDQNKGREDSNISQNSAEKDKEKIELSPQSSVHETNSLSNETYWSNLVRIICFLFSQ